MEINRSLVDKIKSHVTYKSKVEDKYQFNIVKLKPNLTLMEKTVDLKTNIRLRPDFHPRINFATKQHLISTKIH